MSHFITHPIPCSFGYSVFVMEDNGKAFGRVTMYDDPSRCWISDISVEAARRRQGLGSELLLFCESVCWKLGCCDVFLAVERESWMYDWYRRRGYRDCVDDVTDTDVVRLRKSLKI